MEKTVKWRLEGREKGGKWGGQKGGKDKEKRGEERKEIKEEQSQESEWGKGEFAGRKSKTPAGAEVAGWQVGCCLAGCLCPWPAASASWPATLILVAQGLRVSSNL